MTTRLFRYGGNNELTKLPNQEVNTRASLVMRQQTLEVDDDPSAVIERATFIINDTKILQFHHHLDNGKHPDLISSLNKELPYTYTKTPGIFELFERSQHVEIDDHSKDVQ